MSAHAQLGPPITSRTNARVKELRASLAGKASQPGDLLGLEGAHLIGEAHSAGLNFETVFLREGSEALLDGHEDWRHTLRASRWALLSRDIFDSAVTTATPQGIAATWRIVERSPAPAADGVTLILEDLQDPGNVGTLIRSAAAFGALQVCLTPGSANPWNPKSLRSSAGSLFRLPVRKVALEDLLPELRQSGVRIFAAVASFIGAHAMAAPHGVLTGRWPKTETAGAFAQNALAGETTGPGASLSCDTDFLPPCAILVGNEGSGLSAQALALADEHVLIPCAVESLNAAVAGSVLLYEAMRQVPLRVWAQQQGLRP